MAKTENNLVAVLLQMSKPSSSLNFIILIAMLKQLF